MPANGYVRVNQDGTRNVWCIVCHNFICTVGQQSAINTATCAVCQAEEEGIELTPEQVADLRTVRLNGIVMSQTAATPLYAEDPVTGKKAEDISVEMGKRNYFFRAAVKKIVDAGKEIIAVAIPLSKQVAKDNRRKRIFDQDIDEG